MEKNIFDIEVVLMSKLLHNENSELAIDLIEWEDDGEGHYISQ